MPFTRKQSQIDCGVMACEKYNKRATNHHGKKCKHIVRVKLHRPEKVSLLGRISIENVNSILQLTFFQ